MLPSIYSVLNKIKNLNYYYLILKINYIIKRCMYRMMYFYYRCTNIMYKYLKCLNLESLKVVWFFIYI